jgi:hypothetical protein
MEKDHFYKLTEKSNLLNSETIGELKKLTEKYPSFQAAWMLYLKNLKVTGDPGFDAALKKAAPLLPDRKQLYRFLQDNSDDIYRRYDLENLELNTQEQEGHKIPATGLDLIEKFLLAQTGPIKRDKPLPEMTKSEEDDQVVARSVSKDEEMVTETLAMIYVSQKKYDEAVEAFRKLSLKYPEKSIYFASQIEEIEKLRNI